MPVFWPTLGIAGWQDHLCRLGTGVAEDYTKSTFELQIFSFHSSLSRIVKTVVALQIGQRDGITVSRDSSSGEGTINAEKALRA
jgi:hypothetical protein